MGNRTSEVAKPQDSQPPVNTPAGYMYNSYGISTCKYLQKWENLTKNDTNLKWPKWGSFDTPKLIFLRAHLEKAGSKIKLNEWEAYLDWKLEASRRGLDKISSLQDVNKKILETVSELKKATEASKCRDPTPPPLTAPPLYPLLSELPCADLPSISLLPPSVSPQPPFPADVGKIDNIDSEGDDSKILTAPFREKPVSGRGDPAIVYVPWTRTELRNLAKDFPDPLQDPDGFAKESDLTVRTYDPGYSDLFQLLHLLVSESKATNRMAE